MDHNNEKLLADMIQMNEVFQTLVDAAAGYRTKCIEAGFNETAAEQMAVEFHRSLLATAFSGVSK
jgi:hypothetical protein